MPARKLDLAVALRERFEDRTARIPAGDPVLRADLHKVRRIVGPTGHPRPVADRDAAGHADRLWASALGAAAAGTVEPAGITVDRDASAYDIRPGARPSP